jgi:16S rRNA (guanine966-N2)-methyltransferase
VRDNIRRLRVVNALVLAGDVFRKVRGLEHGAYDLVFIDPPYNRALVNRAVVSVLDLVSKSGIIAVEHHKKEVLAMPAGFALLKAKDYGDTRVSFLKRV